MRTLPPMTNSLVYLALFESKSAKVIEDVLRSAAGVNGTNFLTYAVNDDKLRMILAALREGNEKR
jgi:hypothetical protein